MKPKKLPNPEKALKNRKWERFCQAYMDTNNNVAKCAEIAGFKGNNAVLNVTGDRLLKRDEVQNRVDYLRSVILEKSILDLEGCLKLLSDGANDLSKPLNHRVQAISQIAKMCGMEKPKQIQITNTDEMSIEELTQIANLSHLSQAKVKAD